MKKSLTPQLTVLLISALFSTYSSVMAETDFASQERLLRARVKNYEQKTDHSAHLKPVEKHLEFHGVFYGYLPCTDCNGIKATLSLKQNNNYLLVTQPAKESSKEFYEKGKYTWDDDNQIVVLTSRKDGLKRQYYIENDGALVQMNNDGMRMSTDFTLRRSDTVKAREVHIH